MITKIFAINKDSIPHDTMPVWMLWKLGDSYMPQQACELINKGEIDTKQYELYSQEFRTLADDPTGENVQVERVAVFEVATNKKVWKDYLPVVRVNALAEYVEFGMGLDTPVQKVRSHWNEDCFSTIGVLTGKQLKSLNLPNIDKFYEIDENAKYEVML